MGLFNDMVDEKAVTEGIMLVANTILSRVQDEILTKKKIKVTVEVELIDKPEAKGESQVP